MRTISCVLAILNLWLSAVNGAVQVHYLDRTSSSLSGCLSSVFVLNANVGTGNNSETYRLLVDLTSPIVAVPDKTCIDQDDNRNAPCPTQASYDAVSSPLLTAAYYESPNDNTKWTGNIYADEVTVEGTSGVIMKFASITKLKGILYETNGCNASLASGIEYSLPEAEDRLNDGVLGLALQANTSDISRNLPAVQATDSWITKSLELNVDNDSQAVFALLFCSNFGQLYVNGFDADVTDGTDLVSTPLRSTADGTYRLTITDIGIGGYSLAVSNTSAYDVSDGWQLNSKIAPIVLPDDVFYAALMFLNQTESLVSIVGNVYNFYHSLSCIQTSYTDAYLNSILPRLEVIMQDKTGQQFALSLNAVPGYLIPSAGRPGYYCPSITSTSYFLQPVSIGFALMSQYLTVFNVTDNTVGFVPVNKNTGCSPTGSVNRISLLTQEVKPSVTLNVPTTTNVAFVGMVSTPIFTIILVLAYVAVNI